MGRGNRRFDEMACEEFHGLFSTKYSSVNKIKNNETGGAYGTYGERRGA